MQYRPTYAYQEVNTIHFGSVSDSLGQHAAACQCMASDSDSQFCRGISKLEQLCDYSAIEVKLISV